jgi:DNA-binding PadR family transcriptional regulator
MRDVEGGRRRRGMAHRGHGRRGGRMRRGDIRTAVLAVLSEGPGHGYDVIQRLEDKTEGAWRPSPGSVYPTLQLLADEGLAQSVERDGKRVYELTPAGRAETERRIEEAGGTPWELDGQTDANFGQLRDNVRQVHMAARMVAASGRPELVERAVVIVRDARKQLYGLLAQD